MSKKIIIDANFPNETRVVLLSNNNAIESIEYETAAKQKNKGNIYLAKITRIEPSLQAAFIEYGVDKSGFLPFSEIHPNYYNAASQDKKLSVNCIPELIVSNVDFDHAEDNKSTPQRTSSLVDSEEIDLKIIEELIDSKVPSEFTLEVAESDIEIIAAAQETVEEPPHKIQEVIKKGQIILVQVTKEERGNKGASFTTYLSLAGKYCVLMPNTVSQNGVSRKVSDAEERKRLKNIVSKLTQDNIKKTSSIITRTAGKGCTAAEIKRDYDYLVRLWNKIRTGALQCVAPCFIHEEDGIIRKTIRDMWDHTVNEVIVQGPDAYKEAVKFMRDIAPVESAKLKEHKGKMPIFTKFQVEDQLAKLYQPVITLPSGGYVVINPTEALIAIDVNSGKATSERNIEETALKTNLEAAKEIARQLKLRDLSGLIVIDFIDMEVARNRKIIERSFKEFLSRDRARIQTNNISTFGLLEMSRQRLRTSFLEANSTVCSHCNGKGLVRADESNAMLILRTVENEIMDDNVDIVNVYANISAVIYFLNNKRRDISFLEEKYTIKLNFYSDPQATSDNYSVEKIKLSKKNQIITTNRPVIGTDSTSYVEEDAPDEVVLRKGKHKWKVNDSPSEQHSAKKNVLDESAEDAKTLPITDGAVIADEVRSKAPTKRKYRNRKLNHKRIAPNVDNTEVASE